MSSALNHTLPGIQKVAMPAGLPGKERQAVSIECATKMINHQQVKIDNLLVLLPIMLWHPGGDLPMHTSVPLRVTVVLICAKPAFSMRKGTDICD